MKHLITVAIVVALTLIAPALVSAQEIQGGMLDSENDAMLVLEETPIGNLFLVGSEAPSISHDGAGSLYIVSQNGRYIKMKVVFRDKRGVQIRPPRDTFDKVIYINSAKEIIGGVGLNAQEIAGLFLRYPESFGQIARTYNMIGIKSYRDQKFEAIRQASRAFDTDMSEDEQIEYFKASLKMLAGREFSETVGAVLENAKESEDADLGRDTKSLKHLACGIFAISYGDNGGFDSQNPIKYGDNGGFDTVSYGDNGGFDSKGSISYGDNGGFDSQNPIKYGDNGGFDSKGSISYGDNGGFDSVKYGDNGGFDTVSYGDNGGFDHVLLQGWSIDPDLPELPNVDLNLIGSFLMMLD